MEQVTAYKSYDGTVFETEEECVEHERKIILMYDYSGDPCTDIGNALFVYIKDNFAKEVFKREAEWEDFELPNSFGLWSFCPSKYRWVDAHDYIRRLSDAKDKAWDDVQYNIR